MRAGWERDVREPAGGVGGVQELEVLVDGDLDGGGGSGLFFLGGTMASLLSSVAD